MRVIISDVDMGGSKTFMVSREYLARLVVMLENRTPLPEIDGPTPDAADLPCGFPGCDDIGWNGGFCRLHNPANSANR